jgi:hypothetical protein
MAGGTGRSGGCTGPVTGKLGLRYWTHNGGAIARESWPCLIGWEQPESLLINAGRFKLVTIDRPFRIQVIWYNERAIVRQGLGIPSGRTNT